jgi:hypothetical protein
MTDEDIASNVNPYKLSNKTKSQKVGYYIFHAVAELCRRSYKTVGSIEACSCKIEFLLSLLNCDWCSVIVKTII